MLALIPAGGKGNRLGMGEKPLVRLADRPMISYVVDAFLYSGHEPIVIATSYTPLTINWCRANGIGFIRASGKGYVEDILEVVNETGEEGSMLTCVADLPLITPEIIETIISAHIYGGLPACSVWVPVRLCRENGCSPAYSEMIDGISAAPAGVNIITASLLADGIEQEEYQLILDETRLCYNINTPDELKAAEKFLSMTLS